MIKTKLPKGKPYQYGVKKVGLARAKQLWQADPEYAMKVAGWIQILHTGNIKLKSRYKESK